MAQEILKNTTHPTSGTAKTLCRIVIASSLFFLCSCQNEEPEPARTLKVSIALPRDATLQAAITNHLASNPQKLLLHDGTTIIPELLLEDDMTARRSIASGVIKPQVWITLHPSMAVFNAIAVSPLTVRNYSCTAVGKHPLFKSGAAFNKAQVIRMVDPHVSYVGLAASQAAREFAHKIDVFPSAKLLAQIPETAATARITSEPLNGSALAQHIILSICLAHSEVFSARERIAAKAVNDILRGIHIDGYTTLGNEAQQISAIDIDAELSQWETARPQRNYFVIMDASASMHGKNLSVMKTIIDRFAARRSKTDRFQLLSYETEVTLLPNTDVTGAVVDSITARGGSALYDAIRKALTSRPAQQPSTFIVFADGPDTSSRSTLDQLKSVSLGSGQTSALQVYGVALTPEALTPLDAVTKLFNGYTVSSDSLSNTFALVDSL